MNPIVVMPDFFVDRVIKLGSKEEFFNSINDKARLGGGSIRGVPTADIKGGNAANVAYCLAKLGVRVALFTMADDIGAAILRQTFSRFGENVNLLVASGRHGSTTAFELLNERDVRVNIMISDVGDNSKFGPDMVDSSDHLNYLKNSDATVVVNWGSNLRGTQLAEHAFKNSPKSLHFIDPADIETRKEDFRDSLKYIAEFTDVLSINESEYNSLAEVAGLEHLELTREDIVDHIKNAVRQLAEKIDISVDLHTRKGAAWSNGKETSFVRAIKVDVRTLTGAGDSWDSADILGYLAGLNATERLTFANATVSLYLRSQNAEPPTSNEVFELLERIGV
ncbi:MAG: carbohydrate kinase family protein [Thermoproteota archaeon]|nr:carbohydrate kinase family protein [Thermoproteota archaeon]